MSLAPGASTCKTHASNKAARVQSGVQSAVQMAKLYAHKLDQTSPCAEWPVEQVFVSSGSEYCSFSISHACHTVRFQTHADHDLWFKQFMSHLHFMQHHHQHYQVDTPEQQYHQLRLTHLHPLRHCSTVAYLRHCSTVASLRHCSTVLSLFIFWCSERPASCEYQWQGGGWLPALFCH